jgi:hypothetical protein
MQSGNTDGDTELFHALYEWNTLEACFSLSFPFRDVM